MSAQEFGEWITYFTAEQLHPSVDRLRHAQAIAALHNGPLSKKDGTLWATAHFMPPDPWAPPPAPPAAPSAAELAAQVAAINARLDPS
jgi:hypothetical protein